ncbi:MAG: tRNA (adenosine(37)-N6)-dimethylallyltransferase MiaA [Proteobacteria bacterium]|nr:tRNA (adenosine(37)-N6)-dimethylallyltransferase MiaA [Pseudomonadota bacterium]
MTLPKIIQVVGPTASGKTAFSVRLAERLHGELINVDSMQVYRPLAIGTDKPSKEQQARVPIHGIDLIDFGPPMDAAEFAAYAHEKIREIHSRGNCCIISGGTGLYHRAIVYGLIEAPSRNDAVRARLRAERDEIGIAAMYERLNQIDPEAASKIYSTDWIRIERALEIYETTGSRLSDFHAKHGFKTARVERLTLGCTAPRQTLYQKIEQRLDEMWTQGIMEETQAMLDAQLDPEQLPLKALGYKQAAMALLGQCSSQEALELAKRETRRFAKRQLTWFHADKEIEWMDMPLSDEDFEAVVRKCQEFLGVVC